MTWLSGFTLGLNPRYQKSASRLQNQLRRRTLSPQNCGAEACSSLHYLSYLLPRAWGAGCFGNQTPNGRLKLGCALRTSGSIHIACVADQSNDSCPVRNYGTGEMARLVQCPRCKQEDLSLTPQNPVKTGHNGMLL